MRYVVSQAQINRFRSRGFLELADLFSTNEISELLTQLEEARQKKSSGYELQRVSSPLATAMKIRRCARLMGSLTQNSRIILAYTHYPAHYSIEGTLEEISSFTPVVGALLLNLTGEEEEVEWTPKELGSASCLAPETAYDFASLKQPYLLFVFCKEDARYQINEGDPYTKEGRKLGYGFGDILDPEIHPRFSCK